MLITSECYSIMETLEYKGEPKVSVLALSLIIFFSDLFILCLSLLGPHVCMGTICIPGASGGQRKALDPLKLEL